VAHNRRVSDERRDDHPGTGFAKTAGWSDPEFRTASWGREGYSAGEVDEFVDQLRGAMRRDPPTMAPYEVVDQQFKVSRLGRRYQLRPVDEFLDAQHRALRERHGEDAVANLEGRTPEPRHFPTLWIYLVAAVLVAAMVLFLLTQL
jgi:DivIVA domain-containing protein